MDDFSYVFYWWSILAPVFAIIMMIIFYYVEKDLEFRRDVIEVLITFLLLVYPGITIPFYIIFSGKAIFESAGIVCFESLVYFVLRETIFIWLTLFILGYLAILIKEWLRPTTLRKVYREKMEQRVKVFVGDNYVTCDPLIAKYFGLRRRVSVDTLYCSITKVLKFLDMVISGYKHFGSREIYHFVYREIGNIRDRNIRNKMERFLRESVGDRLLFHVFRVLWFLSYMLLLFLGFIVSLLAIETVVLAFRGMTHTAIYYWFLLARPNNIFLWIPTVIISPILFFFLPILGGHFYVRLLIENHDRARVSRLASYILNRSSRVLSMPLRIALSRVYDNAIAKGEIVVDKERLVVIEITPSES